MHPLIVLQNVYGKDISKQIQIQSTLPFYPSHTNEVTPFLNNFIFNIKEKREEVSVMFKTKERRHPKQVGP